MPPPAEGSIETPSSPLAKPAEPSEAAPREFTPRALLLGIVLALLLGGANAYLGLYAGLTVSASIPAAVVSMAVLKALGGATVLENNVVQAIASAGEAVAAGAIFTFPALVILGQAAAFSYFNTTLVCLIGSTMGSLLVILLRRAYVEEEKLPFPEGVACAEVLKAGSGSGEGAFALAIGGALAACLKAAQQLLGLFPDVIGYSWRFGAAAFSVSADLSAALFGVGYIVGLPVASMVLTGGVVGWLGAIPLLSAANGQLAGLPPAQVAEVIWKADVRYLGVGAMLVGGLVTIWRLRGAMARAFVGARSWMRRSQMARPPRQQRDLGLSLILSAEGACVLAMWLLYMRELSNPWLAAGLAVLLAAIGLFATSVAGYLTGIVGASNNPVSGVTLMVLLGVALLLRFVGVAPGAGPRTTILMGAVICTAAAMAGDSLHDLATGFHLGATPAALELGVLIGAIVSSFAVAPIIKLLIAAYGIAGLGGAGPHALAAPQAFLMAKVTQGAFYGGMPWRMIAAGGALAAALAMLDHRLHQKGSAYRTPPMPMAIGLYLPFGLSIAITLGALTAWARSRHLSQSKGVLFAAGLIAGEALLGLMAAALVVAGVKLPLFG